MAKPLVIVESPAKARTIAGFLGKDFIVESSIGHIRDLPRRAGDIPPTYKQFPWARLGVDVDNDFKPLYIVDPEKKEHIKKLKTLLKGADQLYLATDEDREGESIAWHLLEVLEPKIPVKRMVFHEITRRAIDEAINNPRDVDRRLVDAQEARRILDRLYGYEVSPVLWKKVMPRLSAGRVQSVATRMVVERERERIAFTPASYFDIEGKFETKKQPAENFQATLSSLDGERIATGKDFGDDGKLKKGATIVDEATAVALAKELPDSKFTVSKLEKKPNRRSPAPPFMTSTLQQEASRKLRFASQRTMRTAQKLYENGFITYMRTDSTTLAQSAVGSARQQIEQMYGRDFLPDQPREYKNKVKNAQEAHEAIRPAGDVFQLPEAVARQVGPDEAKLYELIWKRTIASQMKDALGQTVSVRIETKTPSGRAVEFAVTGNTITFPGFLRAYVEGSDDPAAELENRERPLPPLEPGELLSGKAFEAKAHETQPPARFTEASLVRRLEELGVGRPSTYASIIGTIQDRGYVWNKGSALIPSFTAFAVIALLEKHFGDLVDYAFTARMEDDLDEIASGGQNAVPWLKRFYFGNSGQHDRSLDAGLRQLVANQLSEIDARAINTLPLGTDSQGREIAVRVGRFGAYLQRGEETASIADDLPPDTLTIQLAEELLAKPSGDRTLGTDPETGLPVLAKNGRFGSYVQLGEPEKGSKEKPRTCSLMKHMSIDTLTLDEALKLLSLPREVGVDPSDSKPITAQLGRYGPYISKGTDSRSLEREEQVFTVTLEEALAIFAQPRQRPKRAQAEPIKELGTDGVSGQVITLREGRFGLYVTDGETNASLRKEDSVDSITNERAQELLQMRRDRAPVKKKKAAKKAAPKKAKAVKAAKPAGEPAAKKAASKKSGAKKNTAKKASGKKSGGKKAGKKAAKSANASSTPPSDGEGRARPSKPPSQRDSSAAV
ncbi:MAG TPA: type I DNA topoisomerase [Polyangiaceae bacterium]|nr:type I DNA topoisomerase [Polyangiaceae bacterium]